MGEPHPARPYGERDGPWRRRARALFRASLFVVAFVIALSVGGFFLFQSAALDAYVKERAVPALSRKIGRDVSVGSIRARFLPTPRVEVRSIRVAGLAGEPPLLVVERATATVDLWRLAKSFGKEIRLPSIVLAEPTLNLVRAGHKGRTAGNVGGGPSEAPSERSASVENVTVAGGKIALFDRTGASTRSAAATPALALSSIDGRVRRKVGEDRYQIEGRAAFASARQNTRFDLTLEKEPAVKVAGTVSARDVDLARLRSALPARLGLIVTSGLVSAAAKLSTSDQGHYLASGNARVDELVLRGKPARGSMDLSVDVDPDRAAAFALRASSIALEGPGIDLAGSAAMQGAPLVARLDLRGKVLDLDQLLSPPPRADRPAVPAPASERADGDIVPNDWRKSLGEAAVSASLRFDRVVNAGLTATDFSTRAELRNGVLSLGDCSAHLYGGTAQLAGSEVDFRSALPGWHLVSLVQDVDLGLAMAEVAKRRPIDARVASRLELRGEGNDWQELRERVVGGGDAALSNPVLQADIVGRLVDALRSALEQTGIGKFAGRIPSSDRTRIGPLKVQFTVDHGWMQLVQPLALEGPFGSASLGGRIGLDGRVALQGKVQIPPDLLSQMSFGRLKPQGPLTLPIAIGGTLGDPTITVSVNAVDVGRSLFGAPRLRLP
jgi:AsmA protein